MSGEELDDVQAQAAQWHARVLAGDADWEAFAHWLDADPDHQAAYDRLALLEDDFTIWASEHAPVEQAPSHRVPLRRWWIAGSAIAAVLVAAVSLPMLSHFQTPSPVYYAALNGQKQITLASGTRVQLDQGTRIAVATGDSEHVEVERGAIYVDVRHGGGKPLEIAAGDYLVRDIGTRFAVVRRDAGASIAVEQGLVDVSWPGHDPVRLPAGRMLEAAGAQVEIRDVSPASVASWRGGRLVYDNASLSLVAADISRYTAGPVHVDPSVANLKLSGVLLIRGGPDLLQQIEAYLPVEVRRKAGAVRLVGKPLGR